MLALFAPFSAPVITEYHMGHCRIFLILFASLFFNLFLPSLILFFFLIPPTLTKSVLNNFGNPQAMKDGINFV